MSYKHRLLTYFSRNKGPCRDTKVGYGAGAGSLSDGLELHLADCRRSAVFRNRQGPLRQCSRTCACKTAGYASFIDCLASFTSDLSKQLSTTKCILIAFPASIPTIPVKAVGPESRLAVFSKIWIFSDMSSVHLYASRL